MRAVKSISISIGGMPIPTKIYKMTNGNSRGLNRIHRTEDHTGAVGYKYYCKECGEEIEYSDIEKGKKISKNQYIPINKDELTEIEPQSSKTLEIEGYWKIEDLQDLLAIHADNVYVIGPEDIGKKPYVLFRDALRNKMIVAYGKICFRSREHLAIIFPYKGVLLLLTLRYAQEVRMNYIDQIAEKIQETEPKEEEKTMFSQMLETLYQEKEKDLNEYEDEFKKNLDKLIEAKMQGETYKIETQTPEPSEDLVAQMKAVMEAKKKEKEKEKEEEEEEEAEAPEIEATA